MAKRRLGWLVMLASPLRGSVEVELKRWITSEWNCFRAIEAEFRERLRYLKATAVFEDVFFGIPFGEAEVEDFLRVLRADAAGLGAEAVD